MNTKKKNLEMGKTDTKIANFYHSIGILKLYLRNSQNTILTPKFMENYYTSSIVNEVIEKIYLFIYFFMKDILCKKTHKQLLH